MIEALIKDLPVEDIRALRVDDYIKARKKMRPLEDDDFSVLKPFKTILVLAMPYHKGYPKYKGKGYGMVSRYSHGRDYHLVFGDVIAEFEHRLNARGIKTLGAVDVNIIEERLAGFVAGMGYLGKNQFLIHPSMGTYFFIATVCVDVEISLPRVEVDSCGACTKCIDACPPGALTHDGGFIKHRCLSYKTQQKDVLTLEELKPFKSFVWGCDICQIVCPKNKAIDVFTVPEFESDEASQLNLEALLRLSNKAFMRKYKEYAFSFRGGLVLKRNAIALIYNQGLFDYYPLVKETYERFSHVAWFEETVAPILKEMENKQ